MFIMSHPNHAYTHIRTIQQRAAARYRICCACNHWHWHNNEPAHIFNEWIGLPVAMPTHWFTIRLSFKSSMYEAIHFTSASSVLLAQQTETLYMHNKCSCSMNKLPSKRANQNCSPQWSGVHCGRVESWWFQ